MSSIQQFYSNQTVFLTGATGFLGKLIIEKLLRSCYDVEKIYILVRRKYDKTQEERFKEIFEQACFDVLKSLHPDFHQKVHLLNGDCSESWLGLDEDIRTMLKNEVTCVIHAAANVKFTTDLRTAVHTNVRSLRDLLELVKEMSKLRSFVYVSTAFSHCVRDTIDEEFYEVDISPEKLLNTIDILDDRTLEVLTPHILGKWPNTYVYSKAVAEELIRTHKQILPIAVVRPAIVTSTSESPVVGWVDNFNGVVGVVIGISLGVLRSLHLNLKMTARLVPADHVVNIILAVGWATEKAKVEGRNDTIPVYNFTGCKENLITWANMIDNFMKISYTYPLNATVWFYYLKTSSYKTIHEIRAFFLHTVFSYLIDILLMAVGKRPIAIDKYRKINKLIDTLSFFTTHSWTFSNKNVEALWEKMDENDRKTFNFDMRNFNWSKYIERCAIGGRIYLMKDPLETLPQAKRRIYILAIIHYAFIALLAYLLYKALSPVFSLVF